MKKNKIVLLICIIIIAIDQLTKGLIIGKTFTIIPEFLSFQYTKNSGAAFGVGSSNSTLIIIFDIILVIIAIVALIWLLKNNKNNIKIYGVSFILSGGISNLIDRLFRGYVVDFIDVNIFDFPCFNIADIFIVIGVVWLIIIIVKDIFCKDNIKT